MMENILMSSVLLVLSVGVATAVKCYSCSYIKIAPNISCGDPLIKDTVPVNVQIVQETVPENPKFFHLNNKNFT